MNWKRIKKISSSINKVQNAKNIHDFSKYLSDPALNKLLSLINSAQKNLDITGLRGSSSNLLVSILSSLGRKILCVSRNADIAQENRDSISSLLGVDVPIFLSKRINKKKSLFEKTNIEETRRTDALFKTGQNNVICADLISLFEKITPKNILEETKIEIKNGEEIDRDILIDQLKQAGYKETDFVERTSEISIRGSILDVYSTGFTNPYRIEFLGDTVKSIREFKPSNQKSVAKIDKLIINPSSFIIFDKKNINNVIKKINKVAEIYGVKAGDKNILFDSFREGLRINDFEWFTPYFYDSDNNIIDQFEKDTLIVFDESFDLGSVYQNHYENFKSSQQIAGTLSNLIPSFNKLYLTPDELCSKLENKVVLTLGIFSDKNSSKTINFDTEKIELKKNSIDKLAEKIGDLQKNNYEIFIYSYSESENTKISNILSEKQINNINYRIQPLEMGCIFHDLKIAIITENDIATKKEIKPKSFSKFKDIPSVFITSFSELKPGDFIVHKEFGIGIFKGLAKMEIDGKEADFIECEYKDRDKVFVPVEKLKLIQKYIGDGKKPVVEKLGSNNWKKTVLKVRKAVETIAKDLLELYAKRKMAKGFKFSPRDQLFNEFEFSFQYNETTDQARSIEEVMQDMESEKPMDRLICGDVGFGKTEVAFRAAFKAVMDGKQVIFIAPTTLLANQHYLNSINRFKDYPVEIEMLSRFRSYKQVKEILRKTENGSLDIVIGTHKLLNSKINFKNLGLIIIDEEQKFGVKHKEYLRSLKSGIDVLALSATPIPRTLQLSLTEIRDISLINTPPENRKPVDVFIQVFNRETVRKAVMEELERNGKVLFIHNRIEKIFEIAEVLKELVPEASIAVTHGRMNEKSLENSLSQFINEDVNLLVTTAIVESGLDIPSANTIIVNDAHTFGLADLYQLKGRVGRSDIKAYSYFLVPSLSKLTADARRRLEVLSELTDLGSGFKLALSDLEIRGAGNLFGREQSGHIGNVGLEFYLELLKETINRLKNNDDIFDYEPEVKTNENAYIPDYYIESSSERLFYYKKLSAIEKEYEINEIKAELEDKFGKIPDHLLQLLKLASLKIKAKQLLIKKIDIKKDHAVLSFLDMSPYSKMFMPSKTLKIYFKTEDKYKILNSRIDQLADGKFKN